MRVAIFVALLACNDATNTVPTCPTSPPNIGGDCGGITTTIDCEYRLSPTCIILTSCGGPQATWSRVDEPGCVPNSSVCPATFADVPVGTSCAISGADVCAYDEGNCACEPCFGDAGAGQVWRCNLWSAVTSCPSPRPTLGSACTTSVATCDYSECCNPPALGPQMECVNGVWIEHPNTACKCEPTMCP